MSRKYVIGIGIAIAVLLINQIFIQYQLGQMRADAGLINLAGRQRMLSQQINLEWNKVFFQGESSQKALLLFAEWKTAHDYLIKEYSQSKAANGRRIEEQLKGLTPYVERIAQQSKADSLSTASLQRLTQNQAEFLQVMNETVNLMQEDSERKLARIRLIEIVLLLISLGIIILEVIYIYVPIEKRLTISNQRLKQSNQKLVQAQQNLQQKNQELEQFVFIASHDLQEPVRTISAFATFLLKKYASILDQKGRDSLHFIQNSASRMRRLIHSLLEYSLLGRESQKTSTDCQQLVREVVADLNELILEKKASFHIDPLPTIVAKAAELRIVFQNLIANAIRFHRPDTAPKVHIRWQESDSHWEFQVSDNGIGIEPAYQARIFELFKQLQPSEPAKGMGVGIGLSNCQKIVQQHEGKIWVESIPGQGSTFFFTIKK